MKSHVLQSTGFGLLLFHHAEMHHWLRKALLDGWQRYRKQLKRCRQRPSRNATHNFRIEARRLLATLALVAPLVPDRPLIKIQQQVKQHLGVFAPLRDVQVQLGYVHALRGEFPAATRLHRWLAKREVRLRNNSRRAARKLRIRKLARRILAWQDDLERAPAIKPRQRSPLIAWAPLQSAFTELERRQRQLKPGQPETIHCLRIAFKRFRYMIGGLSSAFPLLNRQQLRAMAEYQRQMGEIQDLAVLDVALKKFAERKPPNNSQARELSRLRQTLQRRHKQKTKTFLVSAARYKNFWPIKFVTIPRLHSRKG